ncbi:hypothetical protein [Streptomyces sp. NPDC055099]
MSGHTSRLRHHRVLQPAADDGWAATGRSSGSDGGNSGSGSGSGATGGAIAAAPYAYGAGAGRIR